MYVTVHRALMENWKKTADLQAAVGKCHKIFSKNSELLFIAYIGTLPLKVSSTALTQLTHLLKAPSRGHLFILGYLLL